MTIKNIIFLILTILIMLDIILTNFFVIFYDATEINPLCINFTSFMIIKIIVSISLLYIAIKIKNTPCWIFFIISLIILYAGLLFFNLTNVINWFL
jgi:hypothetical protein